jgi:molybdate transport system regulatory protein
MTSPHPVFLRLTFAGLPRFGPGKAALLDLIRTEGSISKAAKAMGMSYKRAWSLVEEMNGMFAEPLVHSTRGGAEGGGATLTATGATVLAEYRALEQVVLTTGATHLHRIQRLIGDMSEQK